MKTVVPKKYIWFGPLIATVITGCFLAAEMPFSNWDYPYQTYACGCLRLVIGFLALVVLRFIYKDEFKRLFCNRIPSKTWIYLIPFWASLVIYIVMFICAEEVSFALLPNFFVNWIIQITTGFWEEAVCRGIFMVGMLCFWKTSVRGRLLTIGTAGLFFGLIHFSSFFFGASIDNALYLMLFSGLWGAFIAAIYMQSENLLLVMLLHVIWDIIVRIPEFFVTVYPEYSIIYYLDEILRLVVLPFAAIGVALFAFKKRYPPQSIRRS